MLKRDKYELEVLNRHIKNENEILREQVKLKSDMNTTLSLQMEKLYKASEKLKKKNKKLNRALINLRFKLVIRKPRMPLNTKQSRKMKLYVLAEVSEYMDWLQEDMQKFCSGGMLSPKDVLSFHQISLHSIYSLLATGLKDQ